MLNSNPKNSICELEFQQLSIAVTCRRIRGDKQQQPFYIFNMNGPVSWALPRFIGKLQSKHHFLATLRLSVASPRSLSCEFLEYIPMRYYI